MHLLSRRNFIYLAFASLVILILVAFFFYIRGNVTVSYYDGAERTDDNISSLFMESCESNKLTTQEDISFVFTEPFPSLDKFKTAPIKKEVVIKHGQADLSLLPGKYGLYMQFENGDKQLYGDLTLENPKNDRPRNKQGPWYVIVHPFKNNFAFRTPLAC